jgi:biotin carboxylase
MKTIVFLGTQKSGSSREAIRAAERLGYYTVLFTDRSNHLVQRTQFPDVHLMRLCDLNNIEELKNNIERLQLRALEISAIISFIDPYCHTACLLAEKFGINRFSTQAISNMHDKIISRQIISQTPYSPRFMVLTGYSLSTSFQGKFNLRFPFIMKSPNSTGSKDVFMVNNYRDFEYCLKKLPDKYPQMPILAEEYLDGPQYLAEVIVYKQKVHIIAIFNQEITHNQRFIITGYNLIIDPPEKFSETLRETVECIVKAHGMESGACHLELRYVKDQWKLVEINPRISGGGMNRLIEIGLGINLVEETLKMALGQEPNLQPGLKQHVFAQYVIISKAGILEKVTGKKKASQCPGVRVVYVKPTKGSLLTPPLSMGHRYAYVIATGKNEETARDNAKHAASQIQFWLLNSKSDAQISYIKILNL